MPLNGNMTFIFMSISFLIMNQCVYVSNDGPTFAIYYTFKAISFDYLHPIKANSILKR